MYKSAWFCTKCKKELTLSQVTKLHGVCPHCGNMSGKSEIDYEQRAIIDDGLSLGAAREEDAK